MSWQNFITRGLSAETGRLAKDARMVIIKHKICFSDVDVLEVHENPYMQFFVSLPGYQMEVPFAPSLFVEI